MSIDPAPRPITVRIKDACKMTGIGRSKLYLLIAEGKIETIKIGSMTLIPVSSLEALLETNRPESKARCRARTIGRKASPGIYQG